jgi:hypothetical protein
VHEHVTLTRLHGSSTLFLLATGAEAAALNSSPL